MYVYVTLRSSLSSRQCRLYLLYLHKIEDVCVCVCVCEPTTQQARIARLARLNPLRSFRAG